MFIFSLGTLYNDPERKRKQFLCKILGGQTKIIMVFFVLANRYAEKEDRTSIVLEEQLQNTRPLLYLI